MAHSAILLNLLDYLQGTCKSHEIRNLVDTKDLLIVSHASGDTSVVQSKLIL